MAYSLTIDEYEFDNPPEGYRKHLTLGNSPVPHHKRRLAQFYQSDQQEIQFEVDGRLSLNEQNDLDELERLQEIAIEGGQVEVDFDPFFSGECIIEDDPFRQSEELGSYRFIMTVNDIYTDTSAYPSHATPTTGNTFTLGSFDFGYDPESVEENYDRQSTTVDRLQGISQSVDDAGLVTKVTIEGNTDGAGQAALWDKARSNELSYLNAEFQNGWALIADLSVQNNDEAPHYLKGLFRYSLDLLIVSNPQGGIGEVSSYIDHDVKDTGTYTSDSGSGDADVDGLDVVIDAGTGSLDGGYVSWPKTTVSLATDATNYVFATDDNGDSEADVKVNQSAFPADSLALWKFETDSDSVTSKTDHRDSLIKDDEDTANSDLVFSDDFVLDDSAFEFVRILALADSLDVDDAAPNWLGMAELQETIASMDDSDLLPALGKTSLSDTFSVDDGETFQSGAATSEKTSTWADSADWDAATDFQGTSHEDKGDESAGDVRLGFDTSHSWLDDVALLLVFDDEDGDNSVHDYSGNGLDGDRNGLSQGADGMFNTSTLDWDGSATVTVNDDGTLSMEDTSFSIAAFCNTTETWGSERQIVEYDVWDDSSTYQLVWRDDDQLRFGSPEFDTQHDVSGLNLNDGDWHMAGAVKDYGNDTAKVWFDGNKEIDSSESGHPGGGSTTLHIGGRGNDSNYWEGKIDFLIIWRRAVTDEEFQNIWTDVRDGYLTTDWKAYSGDKDPDTLSLKNVNCTLNGETITVYVESDTNDDGDADETSDPITLDGSGGPYDVKGISTGSNKFRLRIEMSSSTFADTPLFSGADLIGSINTDDTDQNPNTHWTIDGGVYDRSGNEYEGGGVTTKYAGD